jgi:HEXXH motif-containing protein
VTADVAPVVRPPHLLAAGDLEELVSGSAAAETITRLAAVERSWRLVGMRTVLDRLRDADPGPLPPVAEAWRVLTAADETGRDEAERVVLNPMTGLWVAHLLRRLGGVVTDPEPLWLDIGYLHCLAAAAMVRAGLTGDLEVPVRQGAVVLPTVGAAFFPGLGECAGRVRNDGSGTTVEAGGIVVRIAAGDPAWRATPRCEAQEDGLRIAFALDDCDPYRNLRGYTAPAPLDDKDLMRWQELTEQAWALLVRQDRGRAAAVAAALDVVSPLPAAEPYRPLSASCDESFAGILASMPDDAEQLAVTLVHETQHVELGALLHQLTFLRAADGPLCYAPWRDDPRPVAGLLQGIYAFAGITDFWRVRRGSGGGPLAELEFALWREHLGRALGSLGGHPSLTPHGRTLIAGLASTVDGWAGERVDPGTQRLARAIAADHYGQWRCYHVPVDGEAVAEAARAWRAGSPAPGAARSADPAPVTDVRARWLDSRGVMIRMRLTGVERPVPGALDGDAAFVAGDLRGALVAYERHLAADPGDPRGWLGLALALDGLGEPVTALRERPEFVRAVARELGDAPAVALARWFG